MSERKPKFESLVDEYLHCVRRKSYLKQFPDSSYAAQILDDHILHLNVKLTWADVLILIALVNSKAYRAFPKAYRDFSK